MDDGLLSVNAGFDIPALRGEQGGQQHPNIGGGYNQQQLLHLQQQQQQHQIQYQQQMQQQQYNPDDFDVSNPSAIGANEAFGEDYCDNKTVSTMSSFDIQSMDMSSLGGSRGTSPTLTRVACPG